MVRRASTPQFVGRSVELDTLRQGFGRVRAGEPTFVSIVGEAGVGKSRLVAEFVNSLSARVLAGACARIGEDGPPYAPLLRALREIGALPREIDSAASALVGPTARAWFFQSAVDRLEIETRLEPIVIVIEDLQWSDRASRDLLDFIVRCMPPSQLMVVATVRSDELRRGHPVLGYLGELGRHERSERLDLGGLDAPAAAELLSSLLGPGTAPDVLAEISRRAEGNPYFLEELAAASHQAEQLPSSVRDIVDARLADLPRDAAPVVAAMAVAGRPLAEARIAALAALDPRDVSSLAEIAVAHRLLELDAQSELYHFRHGLIGEVVYAALSPAERRRLHLAVAADLDRDGGPNDAERAAELSHHLARAGAHGDGLRASVRAAEAAERVFAYPEASRQWARARDQYEAVEADERPVDFDRRWLLERNATAAARAGAPDQAVEVERQLLAELSNGDDRLASAASRSRLAVWQWDAGDQADVLSVSARAVADLEGTAVGRTHATVLAAHTRLLMLESQLDDAAEIGQRALEAVLVHAPDLEAGTRITLGAALAGLGRPEGLTELHRGLELARNTGQADEIARGLLNLDYAYWAAGRLREALAISSAGVAEIRRLGLQSAFGETLIGMVGEKLFLLGEWAEAERLFGEAAVRQSIGISGIELRTSAAELAIARGRFAEARDLLREARAITHDIHTGTTTVRLALAEAELATGEGRWEDGLGSVAEAMDALAADDWATFAPRLAAVGLRIMAEITATARARRDEVALTEALSHSAPLRDVVRRLPATESQPEFAGAFDAYSRLAEAELGRVDGMNDVEAWVAVGTAFRAIESPYPQAYALYREVEARLVSRGMRATAAARLADAQSMARSLGAVPLLTEMATLATRARLRPKPDGEPRVAAWSKSAQGLTSREVEVVALVAAGQTNRQIATALFITEKTAGLHVSNILAKLGVANRVEAAAVAGRLGLLVADDGPPAEQ